MARAMLLRGLGRWEPGTGAMRRHSACRRGLGAAALAVALCLGSGARAQGLADGGAAAGLADVPPAEAPPPRLALTPPELGERRGRGGGPNVWVPMAELPLIQLSAWGLDLAGGSNYSDISFKTIGDHLLHGPWEWDHDIYFLNEFAHPFHGALVYSTARSSGLGFWGSIPFAVAGSALWEVAFETDPPSKNDMITTPIGGVVFGEVLHRLSLLVLDEGRPSTARSIAAWALEPIGTANRAVFGRKDDDLYAHPPYWAHLSLGVNFNVSNYRDIGAGHLVDNAGPQLHVGVEVLYGLPGDPELRLKEPFDHFVVSGELELSREFYGALFSRGLIFGSRFQKGSVTGLAGAFGGYDYASPGTLRVAAVSLGLGGTLEVPLADGAYLMPTLVLDSVPFGAGGGIQTPVVSRDYHYGPGVEQLAELQLVRPGVGRIAATGRGYLISGEFVGEGVERIGYLTVAAELMVFDSQAFGMEAFVADRRASYENAEHIDVHQRASQIRFYWTLVTGDGFGTAACTPAR